jgi:teichuronic acid biosynthesis glycosyltransferase TuaC
MIRWGIANADRLIAVSEALKRALVDLGAPSDRVEVLRNGVDLSIFCPTDRTLARQGLALTRPTLLSVGHLIERKGHDRVIEAMRQLPDFDLVIVGEGPERKALGHLARRVGVADRVRFLGSRPHAKLPEVYCATDALGLASTKRGLGECAACSDGVPHACGSLQHLGQSPDRKDARIRGAHGAEHARRHRPRRSHSFC